MSDSHGFFGQPTTCQVCYEPSLPLKHAEVLCATHAVEAGYPDPRECEHKSVYTEGPDESVGIFGWVRMCEDCGVSLPAPDPEEI